MKAKIPKHDLTAKVTESVNHWLVEVFEIDFIKNC